MEDEEDNKWIWGNCGVTDSGDETKKVGSTLRIRFPSDYVVADGPGIPIEEVYAPVETEEQKRERLWLAIKEFSGG